MTKYAEIVKRLRKTEMALNADRIEAAAAIESLQGAVRHLQSLAAKAEVRATDEMVLREAAEAEVSRLKAIIEENHP